MSCISTVHAHTHCEETPEGFPESVLIVALKKSAQISYNFPIRMNNSVILNLLWYNRTHMY